MPPRALIIAGPNGAGKTTFAREFLVGEFACATFINADLIAAGLSPFRPEDAAGKAMRLMAETMHAYRLIAHAWQVYDASGNSPALAEEGGIP